MSEEHKEVAPFARELAILAARGRCEHSHDHAGGEAVCGGGHAQCDSEGNAADGDTPSDAGAGAATAAAADAAADAEAGSDDEGISLQEALEQAAHAAIEAMVEKRAAALRRQAELLDDLTREAIASEDALALLARFQRAQETRVHTYRALEEAFQALMGTADMGTYQATCSKLTQQFSITSAEILTVEAALRDRIGSDSVADLARRVQTLERQKLALVARLQLLRQLHAGPVLVRPAAASDAASDAAGDAAAGDAAAAADEDAPVSPLARAERAPEVQAARQQLRELEEGVREAMEELVGERLQLLELSDASPGDEGAGEAPAS